jgi:uncharacterized membrane protein YhhN
MNVSTCMLATAVAVVALLVAESRNSRLGLWIAKPLASSGFIATAIAAGALDDGYGRLVLAGLALSWLGDVLLIPREAPAVFRAGVLSFLLAHVAYTGAFAIRGLEPLACGVAAAVFSVAGYSAFRWLRPHVPADMNVAVRAYVLVITVMVVAATATVVAEGNSPIFAGAFLFYLSDLSVARDRFVAEGFINRLWGLPFYYLGQLILASTVAAG